MRVGDRVAVGGGVAVGDRGEIGDDIGVWVGGGAVTRAVVDGVSSSRRVAVAATPAGEDAGRVGRKLRPGSWLVPPN